MRWARSDDLFPLTFLQELKQSERLQDRFMQSINRNYCETAYDL